MGEKAFIFGDAVLLAACVLLCELAGVIGSAFTISSIPTWYAGLSKPSFSPPNWVFAPVWITLYAMMGVSLYLVWRKGMGQKNAKDAAVAFLAQLILNTSWSIAFFGLKSPTAGLLVIIPLWSAISLTIIRFRRISWTAAALLVPYLLWVSFATLLNLSIILLNP
jgi:translocator protein